jgi:hypothetical protein
MIRVRISGPSRSLYLADRVRAWNVWLEVHRFGGGRGAPPGIWAPGYRSHLAAFARENGDRGGYQQLLVPDGPGGVPKGLRGVLGGPGHVPIGPATVLAGLTLQIMGAWGCRSLKDVGGTARVVLNLVPLFNSVFSPERRQRLTPCKN